MSAKVLHFTTIRGKLYQAKGKLYHICFKII